MRASHTYKRYVYYLLPILFLAVLLIGLICTLSPTYAAESFSYITADVTYDGTLQAEAVLPNTGKDVPSTLVYKGGASYHFSFKLYRSSDAIDWELCPTDLTESFALYYVGEASAPTTVGTHTIQVRPLEGVPGYKYLDPETNDPTAVRAGDSIAGVTFSIVHEDVTLFASTLDEVASPVRTDSLYGNVMNGAKVILGGQVLTKDTDYTLSLEKLQADGETFSPVFDIDVSGVYRLNATFADTAATATLSRTCLTREGLDPYVLRREFTVSDPSTGLSLNKTSIYVDDTVTKITLTSAPTVAYATALYKEMDVDDTTLYSYVRSDDTHKYSGFEAGKYLYRVTFGADDPTLGVKSGDIVDLPFTVKDIPYAVQFRVNGDYDLTSVIVDNSALTDTEYFLVATFSVTDGSAAANVFMNAEAQKYETSYFRYNVGTSSWEGTDSIKGVGKYKVKVELKPNAENAVQIGSYYIAPETTLVEKQLSVVAGQLRVKTVNDDGVFYYSGAPISPLRFVTALNVAVDPDLLIDEYDHPLYAVKYYNEAGSEVSVQAVGHYRFEVKFSQNITELNVLSGYVYCGEFDVVYPSFSVLYDDGDVSVSTLEGAPPFAKGTDYDLIYFSVSNGKLFHKLGDANVTPHPTTVGSYAAMIVFKSDYPVYNVKAGDMATCFFENNETKAVIRIDSYALDPYDGGVKLPLITFTNAGVPFTPTENVDYSVSYFKKVGDDYEACGYPVYAGTYKCLVTFLKSGAAGSGVIRGAYERHTFVIKPRSVTVTRKDKNDFVYDGEEKSVSVDLRVNGRPYEGAYAFAYTLGSTPVPHPTNVGTYSATLALDFGVDPNASALVKSYALSTSAYTLAIKALELEVRYTVPTGYDAMYSGSDFVIDVKYIVKKGKYASEEPITAAKLNEASQTELCPGGYLVIGENITYSATPRDPGLYFCYVQADNANVSLVGASACDKEGSTVDGVTALLEGKTRLSFTITPCKVNVEFGLTDDLYFTGETKGVESVAFKAYNASTQKFDRDLSTLGITYVENVDYFIDYYSYTLIAETGNCVHDGVYRSEHEGATPATPPTAKGNYYARLVFTDHVVEENKYTLMEGFDENGNPLDHIRANAYVDKLYSIRQQTELAAHVSVENRFEETVFYKVIDLSFIYRGSTFSAGSILYDTVVTYNEEVVPTEAVANGLKVKRSEPGTYTVTFTFHRNTAYRIGECDGEYDGTHNYIAEGDTLVYTYKFIEQKELSVDWAIDPIEYYDGMAKDVAPIFEAETEPSVYSYVSMIKDTHYSLKYYAKDGETYSYMNAIPTDPGEYLAEIVFLEDLPDYLVNGIVLLRDAFTSYSAVQDAATLPRFAFKIEKAVLTVVGITVNDKVFDGTTDALLEGTISFVVKEGYGAKVAEPTYTGALLGHFASKFPCAVADTIDISYDTGAEGFFALSDASAAYYTVEYPVLSAKITRARVSVTPKEVRRQFDYSAVDNTVEFTVSCSDVILDLLSLAKPSDLVSGSLYRESGISVGSYGILTDRLAFRTDIDYEGRSLSEILELYVDLYDANGNFIKYHITKRTLAYEVRSYSKTYGEADPSDAGENPDAPRFVLDRLFGSLVNGDQIIYQTARVAGENVGRYDITVSSVRIVNEVGSDVSENYVLTIRKGTFVIEARRLVIAPPSQTSTYEVGFNASLIGVWDPVANSGRGSDVTETFVNNPQTDRFVGKLSCTPKKLVSGEDDPYVYVIGRGTVRMVNAKGDDVSANYDLSFIEEERTYTITKVIINVKIKTDEIPSKYYGDEDPIIPFTIAANEEKKLGRMRLSQFSSIGRVGRSSGLEDAGSYIICKDNSEGSFIVLDNGKDVTRYFDFNVENMEANSKYFEIKPRPIVVAVEDSTFENTGMDIRPNVVYLNESGYKLSDTVLSKLKVRYAAPSETEFEYKKGVNIVEPVIVGDVTSDPNFVIETKVGSVTVVYLQDIITATVLPEEDETYPVNKNILAGIMLYKAVRFYKLDTANGDQPSELVSISLPIDRSFKGSGYVAVALYENGSPKAFSLSQDGLSLVYEDDGAYYVAIAVVQEWFYAVLGIAAILVAVGLFFLIRLIVHIIKKHSVMTPEKEAKMAERKAKKEAKRRAKEARKAPTVIVPQAAEQSDEVELEVPTEAEIPPESRADAVELPQEAEPEGDIPVEQSGEDAPAEQERPEERVPGQSVFIPSAAQEEQPAEELTKEQRKALRDKERAEKKERERLEREREKEEKERIKREKEEERLRREREKKAKKQNAATPNRPTAFVPTGATDPQESADEYDIYAGAPASDDITLPTDTGDDEIEIPTSDDPSSNDDLVLSKSSSMFSDDDEAEGSDDDEDMI